MWFFQKIQWNKLLLNTTTYNAYKIYTSPCCEWMEDDVIVDCTGAMQMRFENLVSYFVQEGKSLNNCFCTLITFDYHISK